MFDGKDFLICYGCKASVYEAARSWLEGDAKRRLVFIEEEREKKCLVEDPRVKLLYIDSLLQGVAMARELARRAVFLEVAMMREPGSKWGEAFQAHFEESHRAAGLLLSDGAEWGVPFTRNARKNLKRSMQWALDLKGQFKGIPAVVVGAGPSLEKNGHLLKELSKRALILAGGNALRYVAVEPHFGGIVDGQGIVESRFRRVPICFQARVCPKTLKGFEGRRLLAPESHFSFLNWIAKIEEPFDGGWTVGNFLTRLALEWGCNPIVFVGMDGCYREGKKNLEGTVEAIDREGKRVWTQRDWLQAKQWTEELAEHHPETKWINATEGGMGFSGIEERRLEELEFAEQGNLKEKVARALESLPMREEPRWGEWEESLRKKGEVALEYLLQPLWELWKPVFERELEFDPYEGKMEVNRQLFFEEVVKEHLQ